MDWDALDVPASVYPDNGVGRGLTPLLQNKAFSDMKDFTIKVENEQFKVHKMIMIAASHYFKALLGYADAEDNVLNEAELEGLSPLAVSNLVDYIYTNQITGTRARPEDLLEAASYLQIPPAIEMATKFMREAVDEKNCFDYLPIFELYSLKGEVDYTRDFIQSKFQEICKVHSLNTKSYESFLQIVELWVNPEWELFEAIQKWVCVDAEKRQQHMNSLMHQVRFGLLTPDELQHIKNLDIYKQAEEHWTSLVDRAVDYHDLPTHRKVVAGQNKVRQEPTPVVISSHDSDSNMSYALQKDGTWRQFSPVDSPDLHKDVAASVVVNDFLIVCQAFSSTQDWYIFDPRTLTWSSMTEMKEPRKQFALSHDGCYLYAMGGYMWQDWETITPNHKVRRATETDSMVKYDFESDSWSDMDTKLPIPCHDHYTCHMSGFIYMTGGFSTRGYQQCLWLLDRFDPSKESWEPRAPMCEKRPCFSMNVLKLHGEEFIHIMNDGLHMQYYNPRTDQWSFWTSFSDMRSDLIPDVRADHRKDSRVLAHKDVLFLLNFDRDYPHEDDYMYGGEESPGCVTWRVRGDSRHVTQHLLKYLPFYGNYTAGLLAFPHPLP